MTFPQFTARWQVMTGYGLFFATVFLLGLYLTFPYDALKARVQAEAESAGLRVSMESLGPGIFGITAHKVRLLSVEAEAPPQPGAPPLPEKAPLRVDSVAFRPSLFPLGVSFRAELLDGVISGSFGGIFGHGLDMELSKLKLNKGNLKEFSGVDLAGELNGGLSLDLPETTTPGSKVKTPDLGQSSGKLWVDGSGLQVNGGTITVPMGGTPIPQDLPKIPFGDLKAQVKIEKGLATVEKLHTQSPSLETRVEGTLKLNRIPGFSEPNLDLKVKADPQFVKGLGAVGMALSFLSPDKQDPSFRAAKLTGRLASPTFLPAR